MLDSYIIIGITIAVVAIIKTYKPFKSVRGKLYIPLLVFAIAGLTNVLNALVFSGNTLLASLNAGLNYGAIAGGLYSMGQTYLNKDKPE
jgi:hypothetical protein